MADKWDERKKAKEDEYFVKRERELLAKLKAKQESDAKASTQRTSSMRCPKCGEPLKERRFQKIQSTNAPVAKAFGWTPANWSR